ncbi:hypothetical protein [Sphingomonas crusticola]|uniref:hypothetical protein n=1 Tax=Sphingomonas crusticola TaxID=1697973 RepID=UPI000E23F6E2|nr:hypothetical protein [Sphingomonas crusticola]
MNDPTPENATRRRALPPRTVLAIGAAAILAIGGVAGAVVGHDMKPAIEMAPLKPVAIRSLSSDSGIVTVRGRVAEIFGNKLVVDDGSARALVDTGREGDSRALAVVGAPLTAQGRFDRGVLHASFLVDAAGKVTALGPLGGPPDRHGPPHGHGDGPPPPPPGNGPPPPPPPGAASAPAPAATPAK